MYIIIYLIFILSFNYFFFKFINFKNINHSNHKFFVNKLVPITGGFYFLLPAYFILNSIELSLFYCAVSIFLIGLLSDYNFLPSPKIRLLLQFISVCSIVYFLKLEVFPTRINIIDQTFKNTHISLFFTIFCLLILINGSNFIDGLNGLLIGYFLIVSFILYKNNIFQTLDINSIEINFFFSSFIFILFLNLLNFTFLGDNGAYFLGFFFGSLLISIYNLNVNLISPYFIILLLWYPCFENLFSIIRKIIQNISPAKPDNKHLHQYIFIFLKYKLNTKNFTSNIIASLFINIFNLLILYYGSLNINHTPTQISLIVFSVIFYVLIYLFLRNLLSNKKLNH